MILGDDEGIHLSSFIHKPIKYKVTGHRRRAKHRNIARNFIFGFKQIFGFTFGKDTASEILHEYNWYDVAILLQL